MDNLRKKIDMIDKSIQELFLERMQIVKEVALFKKENDLPIYDEVREKEIIRRNLDSIKNPNLINLYREFYEKMIEVSKIYQKIIIEE